MFLLVVQKRRLPKLSNVDVKTTNWSTRTSLQCASLNSLFVSQIELTFESNKKALFQIICLKLSIFNAHLSSTLFVSELLEIQEDFSARLFYQTFSLQQEEGEGCL